VSDTLSHAPPQQHVENTEVSTEGAIPVHSQVHRAAARLTLTRSKLPCCGALVAVVVMLVAAGDAGG
jgi:hypothetical protein